MTVQTWVKWAGVALAALVLAGCSVRFAPSDQDPDDDGFSEVEPIEEPADDSGRGRPTVERQRDTGGRVPDAARGLLASATSALAEGNDGRALDLIQRAQRIAPDAAAVYYALGRVYRQQGSLARAEQFVLKGISKAGNSPELSRSGWSMLAEIRASRGDDDGARKARERVSRF